MPVEDDNYRRVRGLLESNKALRGAILALRAEIERLRSVATAEMKLREGNFAEIARLGADNERLYREHRAVLEYLNNCEFHGRPISAVGARSAMAVASTDMSAGGCAP